MSSEILELMNDLFGIQLLILLLKKVYDILGPVKIILELSNLGTLSFDGCISDFIIFILI